MLYCSFACLLARGCFGSCEPEKEEKERYRDRERPGGDQEETSDGLARPVLREKSCMR